MDEDKNNINTRSLDDLSNLDTNKTSENDKPFHDVSSNLDNDDFINFDEEDKNDTDEDKTDDIFANLNLEDSNNEFNTLDNETISSIDTDSEKKEDKSDDTSNKKSKKSLTKKQKIILICVISAIALVIVCLIVYLLLPKDTKKPDDEPTETIVIDKGNYRYQDGTLVFLNEQKTEIGTYECQEKEEDKCYVSYTSNDLETIINFTYDDLTSLEKKDNTLIAKKGSKYYLISFSDKALTKAITKPIYDYDDKHIVVKNGSSYNLVDYDNNEIYTDYNYISIISSDYVALVNDGSLYIRDYDKNKYNEVGYTLYNEAYSGINTYSKEGVLKSSSYAYKVNVNNNTLTVFLKNNNDVEEKGLNLLDGRASLKQKYYSSFDGILYFYSDLEKTNLLGSYTCTNKDDFNNIEEIRMCAIAHNYSFSENFKTNDAGSSNNFIPIVDNRYVFITDDINISDGEVKVYDLYKKQVLATYKHVSSPIANEEITFINSIDNIIVKNKSDKFGVINIDNNGIEKTYDFVYERMERIGSYIEVAKNNKYQILFNSDSSSITLDSKIYDFSGKYFIVKNNDKFDIYSDDGTDNPKKITNKSYKVIKLVGESLYIAIDDDNNVYVNTYDNTTINTEQVKLDSTSNIFTLYNMISASVNGNNVILNITKEDGTKLNSYTFSIPKNTSDKPEVKPSNPTVDGDNNETQE